MSVRSKKCFERCKANALRGLLLCKRHAKMKLPQLWVPDRLSDKEVCAVMIQALWKGYTIRNKLYLAGPGVLSRSVCHNDDDIVTGIEKEKQDPFQYFAFEEAGKVWWFDVRSIIQWSLQNVEILNPYTKQPLDIDTRRRMHELYHLRLRNKITSLHPYVEELTSVAITARRSIRIVQIMHENGFLDTNIVDFVDLDMAGIWIFMNMFLKEASVYAAEHKNNASVRHKYVWWIRDSLRQYLIHYGQYRSIQTQFFAILLAILVNAKDPFPYCFMIAGILYKL